MPLRKIEDEPDNWERVHPCIHPEHDPPINLVLQPGKYEYTCPACGKKTVFVVQPIM